MPLPPLQDVEHELPEVLDGVDEPITVEGLEEVVRRAAQRRRATLVAGAAALIVVGALGGAVARGSGRTVTAGLAANRPEPGPSPAVPAGGAYVLPPGVGPGTLTPLFRREANGVAVRAYEVVIPEPSQPADPVCRVPPHFVQAELSTAEAVAVAIGPLLPRPNTAAVANLPPYDLGISDTGTFGGDEGAPVTWAILEGVGGLAAVRLRVGGASDTMVPQVDRVVLVAPGTGPGVVEVLDASGGVTHSQPLVAPPGGPPGCVPSCAVATTGPAPPGALPGAGQPPVVTRASGCGAGGTVKAPVAPTTLPGPSSSASASTSPPIGAAVPALPPVPSATPTGPATTGAVSGPTTSGGAATSTTRLVPAP